jgi:hypothetical protein
VNARSKSNRVNQVKKLLEGHKEGPTEDANLDAELGALQALCTRHRCQLVALFLPRFLQHVWGYRIQNFFAFLQESKDLEPVFQVKKNQFELLSLP